MPSVNESNDQANQESESPEISEPRVEKKVERLSEDIPNRQTASIDESGQMLEEAPDPDDISRISHWRGFGRGRCQGFGRVRGRYGRGKGMGFRHRARTGFGLRADLPATMPEFTNEQRIEFLKEQVDFMKKAIQEFARQIEVIRRSVSDE